MPQQATVVKIRQVVEVTVPMSRIPASLKARAKDQVRSLSQQVRFEAGEVIQAGTAKLIGDWLREQDTEPATAPAPAPAPAPEAPKQEGGNASKK